MRKMLILAAIVAVTAASSAAGTVVASSLPYTGTPHWSDTATGGATMVVSGGETIMTTRNAQGVWFGWANGTNPPAGWTIADNAQGNYLSLTARFDAGSDDWSAYLRDGARGATMLFNKTDCTATFSVNCYGLESTPGVSLYFAGDTPGSRRRQFVAIDTTEYFTYEFLLLGDMVTYRINGVAYSGLAHQDAVAKQLVIGDGSGSTLNGSGKMRVSAVSFDRAPAFASLASTAPEPDSWAMLITGFGLVGATLRWRRAVFA